MLHILWYVPYIFTYTLNTILCQKIILQTEAGGGEREAVGRKTRRPEPWLAGQPRRLHAPVHQVDDWYQDEVNNWIGSSLFMEFTISETFSYFGRLLHMSRDQVEYCIDCFATNHFYLGWEPTRKAPPTSPPSRRWSPGANISQTDPQIDAG